MAGEIFQADRRPLWLIADLLIIFAVLFGGAILAIEAETGKPVKIAVQEWWYGR